MPKIARKLCLELTVVVALGPVLLTLSQAFQRIVAQLSNESSTIIGWKLLNYTGPGLNELIPPNVFQFPYQQAESVVVVSPYMNKLTKSELHAIMTGGFATVAGSYMAVLIEVGVSRAISWSWYYNIPESKARWAHAGPTWSRQDPRWANVGPMKFAVGDGNDFRTTVPLCGES